MKLPLVIIECAGYVFCQLFLLRLYYMRSSNSDYTVYGHQKYYAPFEFFRTMQPMQGGNVMSYTFMVQIQVRLCLLETSCEQADHFPAFCSLKVNGSQAFSVSSDSIVLPTQIGKYTVHQTRNVYARQVRYSMLLRSSPFKPREYLGLFLFCCYFTLMFSIQIRISPY